MERQANFSSIFGETFSLITDGVRGALIFVLVIAGLNGVGVALGVVEQDGGLGTIGTGFAIDAQAGAAVALFQLVTSVVSVIASYLLLAHFLERRGRLASRETRIWAYIGMGILSGLGTIVGFILLIVPGVILILRWSAASGFLIGARKGVVESLSASWEATRGHSWPILGAGLVLFLLVIVAGVVVGGIGGGIGAAVGNMTTVTTTVALVSGLAEAVATVIFLAFGIAIYVLVDRDLGEIGEVFA